MIALQAIYKSHRTTVDGSFAITFEAGEHMADEINAVYHKREQPLYVVVMTEDEHKSGSVKLTDK